MLHYEITTRAMDCRDIPKEDWQKVYPKINFKHMKSPIVGLKELRENIETYISEVKKGQSFIVVRRSKPVLKISSPEDEPELWERVIDFTKVKKRGVPIVDLLSRL